jgi:hypothetical protein
MKNKYLLVSFLIIQFLSQNLLSQVDFRKGYIITNQNDTVYGLIDYRGEMKNSKQCSFIKEGESIVNVYKPFDIKAYRFINSKYYLSKAIPIDNQVNFVFAEFLIDGVVDLFHYNELDKDYFFLETIDKKLIELTNNEVEVNIDSKLYTKKTNSYIGQLRATFKDSWIVQNELGKTAFTPKALIHIAKLYHEDICPGEKCIIYQKNYPINTARFGLYLGTSPINIGFRFDTIYSKLNFNTSINPSIGFLYVPYLSRLDEKISFLFEAEVKSFHFSPLQSTELKNNDILIRMILLKNSISSKYTFRGNQLKPYLCFGGEMYNLLYSHSSRIKKVVNNNQVEFYEYDDIPLDQTLYGFFGQIGIERQLNPKLKLFCNLTYEYNIGFSSFFRGLSLKSGIFF